MFSVNKKIIAVVFALLIFAGTAFLFFQGEKVKQEFSADETGKFDVFTVSVLSFLMTLKQQLGQEIPETCFSLNAIECVEAASPNEEIKKECTDSVQMSRNFWQKIKNENSAILGLNEIVYKLNSSFSCPQEKYYRTPSTTPLPIDGNYFILPALDLGARAECELEKGIEFYGLSKANLAFAGCLKALEAFSP